MKILRHFNTNLATWTFPHWLMVIVMAFVGAVLNYIEAIPASQLIASLTTAAGLLALGKGALAAGVIAALGVAMVQIKQITPPPAGGSFKSHEADTKPELKSVPPAQAPSGVASPFAVHRKTLYWPKSGFARMPALFAAAAVALLSCTPATWATLTAVEKVVLFDLTETPPATLPQIEQDVQTAMGIAPGPVPAIVDLAINASIDLLVALGYVPPNLVPMAHVTQAKVQAKLVAAGMLKTVTAAP